MLIEIELDVKLRSDALKPGKSLAPLIETPVTFEAVRSVITKPLNAVAV